VKNIAESPTDHWGRSPELFNITDAAAYLSTSVRHMRRLVLERRIPYHHIGMYLRFARADLDAFIADGRVEG
jgi:excisionase family DNA binding protein